MFEFIFGIVAFIIIVALAFSTDSDSERYEEPEALLGVAYPNQDQDTKDDNKNA
jgi:hypothetical protein